MTETPGEFSAGSIPTDPPFQVDPADVGQRLDAWLAERLSSTTRSQLQQYIKQERVLVNREPKPGRYRLRLGDLVGVDLPEVPVEGNLSVSNLQLKTAFEDEHLLVVDKPAGLVVHPAPGHRDSTLANALLGHVGRELEHVGGEGRCGLIHRLDKLTSGLLVVAKNEATHRALTAAMAERRIDRRYLGLSMGQFDQNEGEINKPLGRRRNDRKLMGVVADGRPAQTGYRVLLRGEGVTVLLLKLHTGRTHQIRVHLQSVGRPIFADPEYGYTKRHTLSRFNAQERSLIGPLWPGRQMLHAMVLRFRHPVRDTEVRCYSAPPGDMKKLLEALFPEANLEFEAVAFEPFSPIVDATSD